MNVFKVNYKDSQTIPIFLQPETVKFNPFATNVPLLFRLKTLDRNLRVFYVFRCMAVKLWLRLGHNK